ncbi:hypothetical protein BVC80_693g26 [Macleaya cordata]|uniref:Myb/SANT-like domain n=1 Tax=Macleaya cordata TaxID=56857 RepID=A0A200Q0S1_MACCD|nr:hypothetical protein BVC80_693g26 [Macleaya cordata]
MEDTTGLGWNPVLCTVDTPNDWWDDYIKRFPRAKAFSERGCPEYEKLETIFGDIVAAGNRGASHEHKFNSTDGEDDTNVEMLESIPCTPYPTTPFDDDDHTENVAAINEQEENINSSSRRCSRTRCGSTRRGRRESKGSELKEELKILAETSRAKLELKTKYTISECLEIIDAMGSDQVGRDIYIYIYTSYEIISRERMEKDIYSND